MMGDLNIFSLVFFVVSLIYTITGAYAFCLNKKNRINKIFLLICLSLAEWAMCFSLVNSVGADNFEFAMFFTRISVFGWGIFYSLAYHFIKLIINPDKKIPLKTYILIYLPALLNIIFFTCFGELSERNLGLQYTGSVWLFHGKLEFFYGFFLTYAVCFAFLTVFKGLLWQYNPNNPRADNKSKIVAYMFVLVFVLGTSSEVIINKILGHQIIPLTVVWLLLPILFMFPILLKHRIIKPKNDMNTYQILDEQKQETIFNLSGGIYLIIAYITLFLNYYVVGHRLPHQIFASFLIYIFGLLHFFVKKIFPVEKHQRAFISIFSIAVVYIIAIRYKTDGLSIILGVAFYYLMITAIYDKSRHTYFVTCGIITVQLIVLLKYPLKRYFLVDWVEYLTQTIVIIISSIVILYINKLYRNKIKENFEQIEIQEAISLISNDSLEVNIENINSKITDILKLCNTHLKYTFSYYYKLSKNKKDFVQVCYTDKIKDENSTKILNTLPQKEKILKGESYQILDVNQEKNFSDEALAYFNNKKILGFYVIPIIIEGVLNGCVVFEFTEVQKNSVIANSNKIISNLIVNTIKKVNYEKILYYNANYDLITGIKNRNGFTKDISTILEKNNLEMPALLALDIDNFEMIHNAFGYSVGTKLLKTVSEMLISNSNKKAVVARFSKDTFFIFYPDTKTKEEIIKRLEKILDLFEEPISVENYEFKLYINIGIAVSPEDGENSEELLKNAELALNEVKKIDKARYHFCDVKDKDSTLENVVYTNKLFTALKNKELKLAYQPQVDCKTGKVIGAEALIRWISPEFGIVAPNKFVPILENTALIVKIGEWIIEQVAILQIKMKEKGLPKIRLSANISVVQFQDEKLIEKIRNIFDKHNVDTDFFELEITENVATSDYDFLLDRLSEIKTLGCSIAIDDFGVEFSSLNRLQSLPVDRLKIDKSFIDGIGTDKKKESIAKIIIQLAKSLGLESIAEGVETEEQVKFLQENNCDEIQGYYFGKPMFEEEFEEFVKENS